MRFRAVILAMLGVLSTTSAHAAESVEAMHFGIVAPRDDGSVTVVTLCAGSTPRSSARMTVTCTIEDASGNPPISSTCESPGPVGSCPASLVDGLMPATVCSQATATYRDLSTLTDTHCTTYGSP